MGSSTAVIGAARTPLLDSGARYLLTPHARAGWYGREMDLLSTGSGFRWLCGLLGWSEGTLEAYALEAAAGANGVRFAPYLAGGEQGALWNSALRGTLQGLTLTSKARDIARAFLEGVLFEIRRCLDVLEEAMPIRRITLAGRAAQSAGLVALAADVLGRAVSPFPHHSPAAIGAALLAPDGDAAIPDLESARIEPGPQAQVYERLYRDHLALFPRIAESLAGS
jgi:sugar (pentulose or hexulose) kinase